MRAPIPKRLKRKTIKMLLIRRLEPTHKLYTLCFYVLIVKVQYLRKTTIRTTVLYIRGKRKKSHDIRTVSKGNYYFY
jgi:hypothetical protein